MQPPGPVTPSVIEKGAGLAQGGQSKLQATPPRSQSLHRFLTAGPGFVPESLGGSAPSTLKRE